MLFHSKDKFYLSFPDDHTVLLTDEKKGKGDVLFRAVDRPTGDGGVTDLSRANEQPIYQVIDSPNPEKKNKSIYTVKALGPVQIGQSTVNNFHSTLETKGLFKGKHYFTGPDGKEYCWKGKGKDMEMESEGSQIAEWEPKDRLLELKSARFGKHKDLDVEFIIASFIAVLAYQDDYNDVDPDKKFGRAKGRSWSERIGDLEKTSTSLASKVPGASSLQEKLSGNK